jgi:FixJ family two-component response regulator
LVRRSIPRPGIINKVKPTKTLVVLVDDDVGFLRALSRLVNLAGFKALEFNHPADVLRARLPDQQECMMLDLFMSEMDAVELSQKLRLAGTQLPIILMTGRQDEHSQRLISQIDHVAVLYKPFTIAELREAIARAMAKGSCHI